MDIDKVETMVWISRENGTVAGEGGKGARFRESGGLTEGLGLVPNIVNGNDGLIGKEGLNTIINIGEGVYFWDRMETSGVRDPRKGTRGNRTGCFKGENGRGPTFTLLGIRKEGSIDPERM